MKYRNLLRRKSYLTLPYVIHSALDLSRTALLCYCIAASRLREVSRWQLRCKLS